MTDENDPTEDLTHSIGKEGEDRAQEFLESKGYLTLARNWEKKWAELDIVMLPPEKDSLVFVEVKTQLNTEFGEPFDAIYENKLRKLKRSAQLFASEYEESGFPSAHRIDVVSVTLDNNRIEHYEAVDFEWQV